MSQIGTFTRDETGTYTGTIKTLTINAKAIIKAVAKDSEKAPDFLVITNGYVAGAGWRKVARGDAGTEYVSLKLDDIAFNAAVYATLVQGDKGEHKLIWSR
jgi:uncharacterized protein (DUF736 family)